MPAVSATSPRGRVGSITIVCSVLLSGLAAGALWCLLSLGIERGVSTLIVPLGLAIGLYFRWLGVRNAAGAACATAAILLAFVYAQYLFAAVRIAQMLGFPLRSTLFKMDLGLAWQVTRANVGAVEVVCLVLACVAGAVVTLGEGKRASAPSR